MKDRVGEVWEQERLMFVVTHKGVRRGVDHHNPYCYLWTHSCVDLSTGEQFEAREWSDEPWESHPYMKKVQ